MTRPVQVWPEPPADYPRARRFVRPCPPERIARALRDEEALNALTFTQSQREQFEVRDRRSAAIVTTMIIIGDLIVVGLALVVAYLCVTKGWRW